MKIISSRRHPQVYGREGRKETYCGRLSIRTRSHHMILMTIKASLFSLFQQPEQKKEQLKPGMGFHGVCDWCSILFRKNKHMLCYNRVHRRPRKQVRVRRPFEASDSRAPVVYIMSINLSSTSLCQSAHPLLLIVSNIAEDLEMTGMWMLNSAW